MYTQSGLRVLCKVASLINDGYLDGDYYDFMEKEAGRRFDGKRPKDLMNAAKQRAKDSKIMPIEQAMALQEAGENIELVPVKGKPGHVMAVSPDNPNAVMAAKDLKKDVQNMDPKARGDLTIANERKIEQTNAKFDRTPQPQPVKKRKQKAQDVLRQGKTNRHLIKDQKAIIGGRTGANRIELEDPIKGGTYAKLKGGKPVRNADGTVMKARDYVSSFKENQRIRALRAQEKRNTKTIAELLGIQQGLKHDVWRLGRDVTDRDIIIRGLRGQLSDRAGEIMGLKGQLSNSGKVIASGRNRVSGLVKALRKAKGRARLIGAGAGVLGLGTGAAAGFFGGRASAPQAEPGISEADVEALLSQQQAANDRLSTYGNIGMAGGATAGGIAGYGLGSALGGGTATKLLLGTLGAWGGGYGGKKLGEYLA